MIRLPRKTGLTLIEVLASVVILAAATAAVVPIQRRSAALMQGRTETANATVWLCLVVDAYLAGEPAELEDLEDTPGEIVFTIDPAPLQLGDLPGIDNVAPVTARVEAVLDTETNEEGAEATPEARYRTLIISDGTTEIVRWLPIERRSPRPGPTH